MSYVPLDSPWIEEERLFVGIIELGLAYNVVNHPCAAEIFKIGQKLPSASTLKESIRLRVVDRLKQHVRPIFTCGKAMKCSASQV